MPNARFPGSRIDRIYRDEAEKKRAKRERDKKERAAMLTQKKLLHDLAMVRRERGFYDPGRFGYVSMLTDTEIVADVIDEERKAVEALAKRQNERQAPAGRQAQGHGQPAK